MKDLILKYKSVIQFILTFLLVYIVMSFAYKQYLNFSKDSSYYPDYVTHVVALQSEDLLNTIGYNSQVLEHPDEPSMKLIVKDKYIGRVIEGCNSVGVIILFMAFIIAFSGKWKTTFFFLLAGSVIIYIANLVRIVILAVGIYHYPQHTDILHSVVFPAIIYGMVFLLWMLWVNRFSNIGKNRESNLEEENY